MELDRGDIDPRLREPPQLLTQATSILPPPPSYPPNHLRLPPPQQQQQPQPHHSTLPPWPQEGNLPYYTLRPESQPYNLPPPDIPHRDNTFPPAQQSDGGPGSESKRPRACEACRGLKVKCDPLPFKNACKRCAKAHRPCIVTAPSRKRQKKTDSRVAELEKKINALEATLSANKEEVSVGSEEGGSYGDENSPRVDHMNQSKIRRERTQDMVNNGVEIAGRYQPRRRNPSIAAERNRHEPDHSPQTANSLKRRMSEYHEEESNTPVSEGRRDSMRNDVSLLRRAKKASEMANMHPVLINETSRSGASSSILADSTAPHHEYADVIDKKIMDAATATKIFNYYVNKMAPHMPIVVFPADITPGTVRKTRPTLFLAILSIACAQDYPQLQPVLTREIMRAYADRLICKREKSLELIQALQVSTTWFSADANFYQLIHMAAVMGIELGMSTRTKSEKERFLGLWKGDSSDQSGCDAIDSRDSKRAWLGCYLLCANAAMGSRRLNLTRWTPYMDECLHDLDGSDESLPSDKTFCQWVKLQRLADDLGTQISTDDVSHTSMSDPKIQYALKGFERQMKDWEKQKPAQVTSLTLTLGFHVVNLYMHDFAMPLDHGLENDKGVEAPGQHNNDSGRREVLTTAHVGALTTCLTSIHGIFNSFLKFQPQDVRTLPIFHFPRLARATVLLIRMYFAATIADSELGKVMPSDHMKAEFYLTNLIELLRAAASDEKCHPAHKLSMVLAVMQVYFERSKALKTGVMDEILVGEKVDAQPVDSENFSSKQEYRKMQLEVNDYAVRASPSKEPAPPPHLAPSVLGDRALHMLSDVAMGSSANGHPTPNGADGWYGYHHGELGGPGPVYSGEFYQAPVGGVEAYAGLHGMHPDLEQAISMALGDGDLNIMDDAGFYHIMQAAPSLFGHIG